MQTIRHRPPGLTRVSVACNQCRQKRIRACCDGEKPLCGACVTKGLECQYQQGESKRKPPSKRYVESLLARIKVLEDELALCGRVVHSAQFAESQGPEHTDEAHEDADGFLSPSYEDAKDHTQAALIRELTDTLGRMTVDNGGEIRYFGSQSNFNLLHGLKGSQYGQELPQLRHAGLLTLRKLGHGEDIPLELQEHLLELYFRWLNPWVYIIEKNLFMRDFWSTNRDRYCTKLLLLAIFSVASRLSDRPETRSNPEDPSTAGNEFAEQARILLSYESGAATTTTVQAAALLSLRGMAENQEPSGWLYIGMATRMAFNLGLNLDSSKMLEAGLITEQEVEARKVTWWGCYNLDKLFCLGVGRVSTVDKHYITCPKLDHNGSLDSEAWSRSNDEGLGAPSRIVSCTRYMSDHLRISTRALDQLYAPNGKLSTSEINAIISAADVQINTFWSSLPSYLRLPSLSRTPALPHIYQLHFQYHVAQILLHRPLITRTLSKAIDVQKGVGLPDIHLKVCRQSASEIVKLLQIYQYHYSLRLIAVGTICHTFTAAIIHLLDAMSADKAIQQQGVDKLRICFSALEEMSTTWAWGVRARQALQSLANTWLPRALRRQSSIDNADREENGQSPRQNAQTETSSSNPGSSNSPLGLHGLPEIYSNDLDWLLDGSQSLDTIGLDATGLDAPSWQHIDPWMLSFSDDPFTCHNFN